MNKDNLLERARNIDMKKVLEHYNCVSNKYGQYSCLLHEDKHPSMSINKNTNKLKCFSCNSYFTTLDVVAHFENESDLRKCALKVLEISSKVFISDSNAVLSGYKCNATINKGTRKISVDDRINMLDKTKYKILEDYLTSRSIDVKVLDVLKANGYICGVDKLGQVTFIFRRFNCCIYRHKETDRNWVTGNNTPITILSNKTDNRWYIVEGLYDALTLVSGGYNVICLNTIANLNNLKGMILSKNKFEYIIAVDNDIPGLKTRDELIEFFKDNNMKHRIFNALYSSNFKDINEMAQSGALNFLE